MLKKLFKLVNLPPKNLNFFFLGVIFFAAFLVLALLETKSLVGQYDPLVTNNLQNVIPRFLDVPLSFFSLLGGIEVTSAVVLFIFLYIYKKQKIALFSLGLFFVVMVFEYIGKLWLYHPNPPRNMLRYDLPFATPTYIASQFSFPSGHVGRTAFIAVVLLILLRKVLKKKSIKESLSWLVILFAAVMIVSRVYLGEHWTSDVVGGLLLGSAMGFFAMVYYD